MTTTMYYFSGTGNSLAIARNLSSKIGESQLIPIAKVWQQDRIVAETEQVGFVFPLYFWGLPDIVLKFVHKLDLQQSTYRFAVVTRGQPFVGGAIHHLKHLLKAKATPLQAGWYVNLPDNYIIYLKMPPEHKQQRMFRNAEEKVRHIAESLQRNDRIYESEPIYFLRPLASSVFLKKVQTSDTRFIVDERCNSCGICQKVCPTRNVILGTGGRPQWQHRCQQCLACLHFCPQNAIEYGTSTINKIRYHHPDVTVKDMMMQSNFKGGVKDE